MPSNPDNGMGHSSNAFVRVGDLTDTVSKVVTFH